VVSRETIAPDLEHRLACFHLHPLSAGAQRDDAQKGRYDATHSVSHSPSDHCNAGGGNARLSFGATLRQ
jgi:hypothetical protein